jgi:hypothetical protein
MKLIEMLKLAAFAVGHKIHSDTWDYEDFMIIDGDGGDVIWAPNTDDDDSFRLMVALGMLDNKRLLQVRLEETLLDPSRGDAEILRMAVLRCAAEIGKSMKEKK